MDEFSWALCSDNIMRHNKLDLHKLNVTNNLSSGIPQEGDVIGVSYDHIQLRFYLNGKEIDFAITNVKGTVFPALYGKIVIFCVQSSCMFFFSGRGCNIRYYS